MTLAQQLVNREKTKTQLINDGFNRYSLNAKDGLPSWFLDDESKHYKPNIPVTKEAIAALRAKQRALDARPIKKVAEAKARKKYKAAQRLDKAMKKAEGVNSTSDMSEREKASQIEKLMRKGLSKGKPKKEVKLVVAKGAHKGVKGRPKGVKGRYTMVDSRMKKEVSNIYKYMRLMLICPSGIVKGQKACGKGEQKAQAGVILEYYSCCYSTFNIDSILYYIVISGLSASMKRVFFEDGALVALRKSQALRNRRHFSSVNGSAQAICNILLV